MGVDEVQINTPLRPCKVDPISREDLKDAEKKFKGIKTINVYDKRHRNGKILDRKEFENRGRPNR